MKLSITKTSIFNIITVALLFAWTFPSVAFAPRRDFYQLKIYHLKTKDQEKRLDSFLENAFLPALHRLGISKVGVFKPIVAADAPEPTEQLVYVFIPFKSSDDFLKLDKKLAADKQYALDGQDYLDAAYNNVPYARIESILLSAFVDNPQFNLPALSSPKSERVYELRSYEGPTEKLYLNKVDMFNRGGEVALFKRLGFNAVFYGEVISGGQMPNLIYMTTFENKASRDEHWKAFSSDPTWKKLSAMPEYQHNVSKNDTRFLRPTDYSDI
ncbi:NIPSNAP family protein [Flectobacillus major]|jgi:hypothetical protein|uniref:NIPSNAP family protein n=1 Tax=Flectobacillus major TaxID=103 RepID=UPI0004277253|nr:NIPSNAP family protein [Flectobacillus major]